MSTPVASSVSMDTPSDAAAPLLSPAAALKLNCSDAEREAITAFRARVADVLPHASARWSSDSTLLRFLRARKLNFEAAEAMYRDVIAWRREVRADHILNPTEYTEPEAMKGYFATGIHGVDLDGHAVLVERVGVLDVKGLTDSVGVEEYLKWIIYYHERQEAHSLIGMYFVRLCSQCHELSMQAGEHRDSYTVIADLHGASVRHMAPSVISIAQKRARLEEDHYPEVAKRVFIIRAPRVFSAIFNLIKPMLDEGTREKIFVLGADYMTTLRKFIHPDQIPQFLGGSCACEGDPQCRTKICAGGMVPASLRAGLPASSVTVDIKNGHSDVSVLPVDAGTKITWNFKVAANDVNFFAFFAPASVNVDAMDMRKMCAIPYGNPVIVAPSRISQASGEYIAKSEGHVVLVWDNTFSWFQNKSLMKQVDLHEPEQAVAAAVAAAHATGMPAAAAESSPAGGAGAPPEAQSAPPE